MKFLFGITKFEEKALTENKLFGIILAVGIGLLYGAILGAILALVFAIYWWALAMFLYMPFFLLVIWFFIYKV